VAGAESFTVLAILEARDAASEIFAKVDESLDKFSDTAKSAADTARGAGEAIDESLAQTASGADALELASARVEAAQSKQAQTASALADAERNLLAITQQDAATEDQVAAAANEVAAAQEKAAASAAQLKEARSSLLAATAAGDEDALAVATERVAVADREAAGAASDLAAAQARQASLNTSDNVAAAAQSLTAAEKDAKKASDDLTASQARQADVQKAVAASDTEAAAAAAEEAAAQKDAADKAAASSKLLSTAGRAAGITALGLGVAAAVMVKAAGNFQDSTTHLVTDAGESAKNLAMVQAGILSVSTATGQSASDITNAMYHIESSGFHAATGLAILKTAAEGARVGGADLDTTSKALVGTMTAYYGTSLTASQATKDSTSLMNQLVETVGSGDMRMQDLASSLSAVTPVAAAAHVSFAQVGGAIATMTAQGMSAQQTTQDLAHFIRSMQAPTLVSSNEMKALGLNANALSANLGKTGLAGTIDEMRNAILRNTSGGSVMLGYLKEMSPAAQSLANQILSGSITTGALTTAVKGLNPEQAHLITMFKSSATSATGLKQTYTQAMSKMVGGATGLNVALMLSGKHMGDLTKNTAAIAAKAKDASGNVQGWSTIQGTFNFKVAQAKTGIENTGIAIGTALLPAVTSVLSAITKVVIPIAEWTAKHKTLTEVIFVSVTAIAAVIAIIAVAKKAFDAVSGAVNTVKATLKALGLMSKETAGTQAASAKSAADAQESSSAEASAAMEGDAAEVAAANEDAAEESADKYAWMAAKQEASSAEGAAAAEEDAAEVAAANDEAAVESSGSWVASAATTIGAWATAAASGVASAASWVAQQAVKVASVVASNVAGAAATAGAWVAAGAQQAAGAAVWVAQTVAKVAVIVASNVAGAAVTMAAWIAANAAMLLGIGLIVLAVIAAVLLIVKYWRDIEKAAVAVWGAIVSGAKAAWSGITGFVRAVWSDITGDIRAAHALIMKIVGAAWSYVKSLIRTDIDDVKSVLSWFGRLASLFRGWWDDATDAVHSAEDRMIGFVAGLPGRILSALGDLGSLLFGAGEKVIQGLIRGVENMLGSLGSTMSSVASTITSFLPFSPAKRGPLSGSGDPSYSGRSIARSLAKGIVAGRGDVTAASHLLASSASLAHAGGSGAGALGLGLTASSGASSGSATIVIDVHDNTVMSDSDINNLVRKLGPAVTKSLAQAGVKVRMP